MSEPVRFLTTLAQTLSTMSLYKDGHPARERVIDHSFIQLQELQRAHPQTQFTFLGEEVVFGQLVLRELKSWDWSRRLASAGVQRLEFPDVVTREDYESFLEEVLVRLNVIAADTSEARQTKQQSIRFGTVGIKGETPQQTHESLSAALLSTYSLAEEAEAVKWVHGEVRDRALLPLAEAEAIVRSLSVAMHSDSRMVIPLLQLKEFDQYTTTHSMNVSVLTMALAEYLRMGARDVRSFGVAGLLHDLGKVRIPREILNKPGKLTQEEREIIQRHPSDGARIILEGEQRLDLAAAVAYEHHIMLNGGGYPCFHVHRDCHPASRLVHVCDVYDALRTRRPYRDAWESERTLTYIEEKAGTEFEPEVARAFVRMMREWDSRVATYDGEGRRSGAVRARNSDGTGAKEKTPTT